MMTFGRGGRAPCNWPGCTGHAGGRFLYCRTHWALIPPTIRDDISHEQHHGTAEGLAAAMNKARANIEAQEESA